MSIIRAIKLFPGSANNQALEAIISKAKRYIFDEAGKQGLIEGLTKVRQCILSAALALPGQSRQVPYLGEWSVTQIVAHLIGWAHANLAALQELKEGKLPGFYEFHDRNWHAHNRRLVNRYDQTGFATLLAAAESLLALLMQALQILPIEEFENDHGVRFHGWRVTKGRLMRIELHDEQEHLEQLLSFQAR